MIDYKTLIKLVEKYDEETSRVFNKLKKADMELIALLIMRIL